MEPSLFKRSIFVLFLGWPGMILSVCGYIGFVVPVASTSADSEAFWPNGAGDVASSAGIFCIGFFMFHAAKCLTGWLPERVPVRRLGILAGCQVAAFLLGGIAGGCFFGLMIRLLYGTFDLRLALAIGLSVIGLFAATVIYRAQRMKRDLERLNQNL